MRMLLSACLLAVLSFGTVYGQEPELALDPPPYRVSTGDVVTFSGMLAPAGVSPEGTTVYITCGGGDIVLTGAPVDGTGRFTVDWTVAWNFWPYANEDGNRYALCGIVALYEDDAVSEGYAAVYGGDAANYPDSLDSVMYTMYIYRHPLAPESTADAPDGYAEFLYPALDFWQAPRVLIMPSSDYYDEVRMHIIPAMEGIIQLTAMLEREYGGGNWDVSFGVLDREWSFDDIRESDIIVNIVTDREDPLCGVDHSGQARNDDTRPIAIKVCSLERYSNEQVRATAAHEFMHAIGLGHTFNIAGDRMCGIENGTHTCNAAYSKSYWPSDFNLAAIVAAYGTDGFTIPNHGITRGERFTFEDYQNQNHLGPPQGQDRPELGYYPDGNFYPERWEYGSGEEVFLHGSHPEGYGGAATVTIFGPHGDIEDTLRVGVVDGHFAIHLDGYDLPGTYFVEIYGHRGGHALSSSFDVVEDPSGHYVWVVSADVIRHYSGSAIQISGYGPRSDHGSSWIRMSVDGNVVADNLPVYPVAGRFAVDMADYVRGPYRSGHYLVELYVDGEPRAFSTFTLVGSGTAGAGATVSNTDGSSVPGCEVANECFVPHMVTIGAGETVTWTNDDGVAHTVTSGVLADGGPDGMFDSGSFAPGTEFSYTFERAGEYPYYCLVHPWMAGMVVVE